eukprot:m.95149 g.95149  ORF g.95149 m.95149 type:complete len:334 (-) comp26789_c2_seq1:48-1049(-)
MKSTCLFISLAASVTSHGSMTIPPSRNNGSFVNAGDCSGFECFWFSQITSIPGIPTLNASMYRTVNVNVSDGSKNDWSAQMPWRAPGTAPVHGHGCGVAGGSDIPRENGGIPPPWIKQGTDGITLPDTTPTVWKRGSIQEVAFAMLANHGGGYSYRLCPNVEGEVTEECFQANPLDFAGSTTTLRYADAQQWGEINKLPEVKIPRVTVDVGTFPPSSQWARNPIPSCDLCNQADCMSKPVWIEQQHCSQGCAGLNMSVCPPYTTHFPEPAPGISGYYMYHPGQGNGLTGFTYNLVDEVHVPTTLKPGSYLLSWRWDCEQSRQIWQNCADITIE